jgi:hypothetical protein
VESMRLFAIALALVVVCSFAANAQDGPKLSSGAVQASKEFNGYLEKTAAAKGKPNLATPPAAPLFAKIFDTKALTALPAPTAKDLSWTSEWLGASANSYMALINFGTNPQAPDYQKVLEDNVQVYEDEISNAMDFMAALSTPERNQPARQQGVKNIRDGYMQTVSGATSFVAGGVKVPNARLVARALRDTVDEWSALTTPEERTQLIEVINQARESVKDADAEESLAILLSALKK